MKTIEEKRAAALRYHHERMKDPDYRARVNEKQRLNRALRHSDPIYDTNFKIKHAAYRDKNRDRINHRNSEYQKTTGKSVKLKNNKVSHWNRTLCYSSNYSGKKKGFGKSELTPEWILEQFEKQDGKCFYSNLPFVITADRRHLRQPSLDRKDPKVGYTKENVVLCLWAVNAAKGTRPIEELNELLEDLRQHGTRN